MSNSCFLFFSKAKITNVSYIAMSDMAFLC